MYESTQHSCVSTACYFLDKYGNAKTHIAHESGTGERPFKQGAAIEQSTIDTVLRLLPTSMDRQDIAAYCRVSPGTVGSIAKGRHVSRRARK